VLITDSPLAEARPIRQARQWIVQREMPQSVLAGPDRRRSLQSPYPANVQHKAMLVVGSKGRSNHIKTARSSSREIRQDARSSTSGPGAIECGV
jgi:hypothetical protein